MAAATTRLTGLVGVDLLDFSDATGAVTFTLSQGTGPFSTGALSGIGTDSYSNMEGVIGSAFADTLTGSSSADTIRGGGGNDTINAAGGNDRIEGGNGADTLTGGNGNDVFVFNTALNAVDTIADFDATNAGANADKIELSSAFFSSLSPANPLDPANFVSGAEATALDANDYITYDTSNGNLYYDADGSGAGARILVRHTEFAGRVRYR